MTLRDETRHGSQGHCSDTRRGIDDPYIVRLTRDEGRQVMGVIRHGEKGPSRGSGCAPMKLSLTTSQGVPVLVRTALRPLKPSSTRVLRRSGRFVVIGASRRTSGSVPVAARQLPEELFEHRCHLG